MGIITKTIRDIDIDGDTVEEAIDILLEIKNEYKGWNLVIDVPVDGYYIYIEASREETQEEVEERMTNVEEVRERTKEMRIGYLKDELIKLRGW